MGTKFLLTGSFLPITIIIIIIIINTGVWVSVVDKALRY